MIKSSLLPEFAKYNISRDIKSNILWKKLQKEYSSRDTSIIYLQTGTIYQENIDYVVKLITVIMEKSAFQVRILTSSILIFDLACKLNKYKSRILYGMPLKLSCTEKIPVLQELQNRNFLTYATIEATSETINTISLMKNIYENLWIYNGDIFLFKQIILEFKSSSIFNKIRYLIYNSNITNSDDQFYKLYLENIIYMDYNYIPGEYI